MRSRGWCFTLNNFTEIDMLWLSMVYESFTDVQYLIFGKERGREGTKHLQGYIYFKEKRTLQHCKEQICDKSHWEPQKARKNVEAYCYCMKDDNYIEYGERPRQGHRTDLEVIKHDIKNGKGEKWIQENYFSQWCQYRRAFNEYRQMVQKHPTKLYAYGWHDFDAIKKIYKTKHYNSIVYSEPTWMPQIVHEFYSGKYKEMYIAMHKDWVVDEEWKEFVDNNVEYI